MTEIQLTKEEQLYIRQQVIDRYIDKQVDLLFEKDEHDSNEFLEPLTDRFKVLADEGKYDKQIYKAFKDNVDKNYISEFFNYPDVEQIFKNKILELFK